MFAVSLRFFTSPLKTCCFCSCKSPHPNSKPLRTMCSRPIAHPVPVSFDVYEANGSGTKTPLLILHGLLGSKTNWKSLSKIIAGQSGRKIYCLDARNHGESPHHNQHDYFAMAADVELFMKNQNIENCVLLGHSMGGRTAMATALMKPSLVERLVVVDVSPLSPNPEDLKSQSSTILDLVRAMKMSSHEIVPGKSLTDIRRAVDKNIAKTIHDIGLRQFVLTNLKEEVVNGEEKVIWRLNLEVLENSVIAGLLHFPGSFEGKVYTKPTLFICGSKSNYLRPEDHGKVKTFFPSCEIEYIADAGHWVHAEKPTEFLKKLSPFL